MEEEPESFVQRLRALAAEEPDAPAYTHVALDGGEGGEQLAEALDGDESADEEEAVAGGVAGAAPV